MTDQDTKTVTWNKKSTLPPPKVNPPGTKTFHELDGDCPPPPTKTSFSTCQQVMKARCGKKMTQKELSSKLNVHLSEYAKMEKGDANFTTTQLRQLSQALGVKFT
jgi:ribosome-binding protein aMBF1 (putative translation factor)